MSTITALFHKWSYNLNRRLRVIAFYYSLQMRKGWQYFSGRLRAFLRRTRLFRWSSFDCRDLYERPDQIRLTPIRLGIGSAGCASHSSANLGKSNFPTMFFSQPRRLRLPILSILFILRPHFLGMPRIVFGIRVSKVSCVPKVHPVQDKHYI